MFKRLRLSQKIIISSILIVFITGLSTFLFVRNSLKNQIEKQLSIDLGHTSHYLLNVLDVYLLERLHDAESNANILWQKKAFNNTSNMEDFCCLVLDQEDLYSGIYLINNKGEEITFQSNSGSDFFKKNFKNKSKDFKKGISFIQNKHGKYTTILFSAEIIDAAEQNRGTLLLTLPIEKLEDHLHENITLMNMGKDVAIELFDNNGTSVFSKNNISIKNTQYRKELISALTDFKSNSEKLVAKKNVVYFVSDEKGYHEYKGNEWHIFIGMSTDKAFSALSKVDATIGAVFLILIVIVVIFSFAAARMIAIPFSKLSALISNYSKFNFKYDADIKQSKEFIELGKKLKSMGLLLDEKIETQKHLYKDLKKQHKLLSEKKQEIETQQAHITSGIKYAQKIQNSLLPFQDNNQDRYSTIEVYFNPLQEVSGDYYFVEHITHESSQYHFYALVDCTGHGVPGAFMSIIAHNLLYHAINSEKILDPGKILTYIDNSLNRFLGDSEHARLNDGMDVSICIYNSTHGTASFAGAYRPLLFYNTSEEEIITIKGDKKSIGYKDPELFKNVSTKYNTHKFLVNEGDRLIMFSDGITDQFGGTHGKKIGIRGFMKWIIACKEEPNFSHELFKKVDNWKRNYSQIDDMTILSIEFKSRSIVKTKKHKRTTPRFLTGQLGIPPTE